MITNVSEKIYNRYKKYDKMYNAIAGQQDLMQKVNQLNELNNNDNGVYGYNQDSRSRFKKGG